MNKTFLIPLITLLLLFSLLVLGGYSSSDSFSGTSFLGNVGSSNSGYQIVEVGGYQFKVPGDLKLADERKVDNYHDKFFTITGNNSIKNKGVFIIVWKNYPLSSNEFVKKEYPSKAYNIQEVTIAGHQATKFYINSTSSAMYSIRVNNDIITISIFDYTDEMTLVETILSIVFSDNNNKFGGGSQSSDNSSDTTDEDNTTNKSNSKTNNNKNSDSNSNNNNNDKKHPNEEPLPPSDDYSSGGSGAGTGGWY